MRQRYIQHFPAAGEVVIFDRSFAPRARGAAQASPVRGYTEPNYPFRYVPERY